MAGDPDHNGKRRRPVEATDATSSKPPRTRARRCRSAPAQDGPRCGVRSRHSVRLCGGGRGAARLRQGGRSPCSAWRELTSWRAVPIASTLVIERGGNGKGNGRSVGRRPRRVRGCGDCPARMEWRVARARLVEEESGLFIQSVRQVLEREPSGVPEWAIEQSRPVGIDEVVSSGQGQARSEDDPCMGDEQRDRCTNSRPDSRRCGTSVQRRQRPLLAVPRVHGRPEARSRQPVAHGLWSRSCVDDPAYRCPGMYDR
jgi:hypothetical protein